jgi:hypothetical protein
VNTGRHEPAASPVLQRLGALVGEWDMLASMGGHPTGRARAVFEPLEAGAFLIQHVDAVPSEIEVPPEWVANSPFPITAIIGLDLASETFSYLYSDARGVHRVYRMSLADGVWTIWGQSGPEFFQRFTGTLSEDRGTITGRWEASRDGTAWQTDFDVTYTKAG